MSTTVYFYDITAEWIFLQLTVADECITSKTVFADELMPLKIAVLELFITVINILNSESKCFHS